MRTSHARTPRSAILILLLLLPLQVLPLQVLPLQVLPLQPLHAQDALRHAASGAEPDAAQTGIASEESIAADLLREAARETASHVTGSALLRIHPDDAHPAVRQLFAEEFSRAAVQLASAESDAGMLVTLDVRELKAVAVALDKKSYLRSVVVRLGALVEQRHTGSVAWSKELLRTRSDTLAGAPSWREKDLRCAETRSWFESILVPVVTSAAAIVLVVLLFTVRGK